MGLPNRRNKIKKTEGSQKNAIIKTHRFDKTNQELNYSDK